MRDSLNVSKNIVVVANGKYVGRFGELTGVTKVTIFDEAMKLARKAIGPRKSIRFMSVACYKDAVELGIIR